MKYFTYILKSTYRGQFYIGSTQNLKARIIKHNSGQNKSTKEGIPWVLVYHEEYETRSDAYRREKEIKSKKSRKYIENLLNS